MIIVSGPVLNDARSLAFALHAAGLDMQGDAPASLEATLAAPHRYWKDALNEGVFFETNPFKGRYLLPGPTQNLGVVMTSLGVTKSDPAYLDQVIVLLRSWRCCEEPMDWLRTMYEQVADSLLRRYPTWLMTYESLTSDPASAHELAAFLGTATKNDAKKIDAAKLAALSTRLPALETQHHEHPHAALLDELYATLRTRSDLSDELVEQMNEVLGIHFA